VRKTVRAADIVEMGEDILSSIGSRVKRCNLIESPLKATFGAHAVVAGEINHKGVVMDS